MSEQPETRFHCEACGQDLGLSTGANSPPELRIYYLDHMKPIKMGKNGKWLTLPHCHSFYSPTFRDGEGSTALAELADLFFNHGKTPCALCGASCRWCKEKPNKGEATR